jgi:hypothetical protein
LTRPALQLKYHALIKDQESSEDKDKLVVTISDVSHPKSWIVVN